MLTTRPRGTADLLPGEVEKWQYVEERARDLCRRYGYREIRTPLFEHTELFVRSVGAGTDIVEKEMYTFRDRGGRELSLRPEGTAGVVRAFLENGLHAGPQPVKLFYLGPMFRYDRPQAGRLRQFHQFGVEVFGSADPAVDAEVIALTVDFFAELGTPDVQIELNSVGCPECRPVLAERLRRYLAPHLADLCGDCRRRLERSALRVLDCKNRACRALLAGAPTAPDYLCAPCADHFAGLRRHLERDGIGYRLNPHLVRGLDYYTRTAFEITVPGLGAQNALGGGGRYDGLVEECGGPRVPAVGCAVGMERILLYLAERGVELPARGGPEVYLVEAGAPEGAAADLLRRLRRAGLAADRDYLGRSLKAQMKHAARLGVAFTLILGADEWARGCVAVRHMETGQQEEIPLGDVPAYVRGRLNRW